MRHVYNDHQVSQHTCRDNTKGWPVCQELDPESPLIPRLVWEEPSGCTSVLRCTGHVPYEPDALYEKMARERIVRLQHRPWTTLPFGRDFVRSRRIRELQDELMEVRNMSQRFLPLRPELMALASEMETTLRALRRFERTLDNQRRSLQDAALAQTTLQLGRKHPQYADRLRRWEAHVHEVEGFSSGEWESTPEVESLKKEWRETYRELLLTPLILAVVSSHGMPRPFWGFPILQRWSRVGMQLIQVPSVMADNHDVILHRAPDEPVLREMLPSLWQPGSTGPLREFDAAVEAARIL